MSTTPAATEVRAQIARTARALDSLRMRHATLRLRTAALLVRQEFAAAHAISVQVGRCHPGPDCTGQVELIAVHDTAGTVWHVDRDRPHPGHEHVTPQIARVVSDVEHELGAAMEYGAAPLVAQWHQVDADLYDIDLPDDTPRDRNRPAWDTVGQADGTR